MLGAERGCSGQAAGSPALPRRLHVQLPPAPRTSSWHGPQAQAANPRALKSRCTSASCASDSAATLSKTWGRGAGGGRADRGGSYRRSAWERWRGTCVCRGALLVRGSGQGRQGRAGGPSRQACQPTHSPTHPAAPSPSGFPPGSPARRSAASGRGCCLPAPLHPRQAVAALLHVCRGI